MLTEVFDGTIVTTRTADSTDFGGEPGFAGGLSGGVNGGVTGGITGGMTTAVTCTVSCPVALPPAPSLTLYCTTTSPVNPAPGTTRMPPGATLTVAVPLMRFADDRSSTCDVPGMFGSVSFASTSTVNDDPVTTDAVSSTATGLAFATVTVTVAVAEPPNASETE